MANKTDGEVEKSIISSDMKIKGKITASGGLVLLGNVVGDIKCNSLSIEESGVLKGNIVFDPRGTNGFGYDPIFEVSGKTLAEMTLDEKSNISHRKLAAVELVRKLNEI